MIARAGADLRGGIVFVSSMSQTDAWVWIGTLIGRISADAGARDLGHLLHEALRSSEQNVPHPSWEAMQDLATPLLRAAGVSSFGAFVRGARHVDVAQDNGIVTVMPTRNLGAREGFEDIHNEAVQIEDPDNAELGIAVGAAFARCT